LTTTTSWIPAATEAVRRQAADLIVKQDLPGAVVGLVAGGELAWSQGFAHGGGPARPDDGARTLDADTLFRVASITKTFTATAIVQLRDSGKLHLDDPLVKHVPEFGAVENPFGPIEEITLRRLASHSSGLYGEPPGDHWSTLRFPTRDEWLAGLPQVKIAIPPGSAFKYSNLAYTLLGEVIERLSGQPYVEYMQQAIFEPLGMASSAYELTDQLRSRAAAGHLPHPFEDVAEIAPPSPLSGMAAAGQLWTTVRDLSRWIAFHLVIKGAVENSAQTLRWESRREMQRAVYVDPAWASGYGVGWAIRRSGERVFHGHGGSVPGYRSQILFNAALKIGIIVLIDGVGAPDEIALELMNTVAGLAEAAEAARPTEPPARAPEAYRPYLGMYTMSRFGAIVHIEYRGGKLVLTGPPGTIVAGPPTPYLDPTDEPRVFMVRGGRCSGETLTFSVADDGQVSGFKTSGFPFYRLSVAGAMP
jgi:CubicO group peptidase (beta-lactamase class C family)